MAAIIGPGDHLRPPKMVLDPFFLLLFYLTRMVLPGPVIAGGDPFMAAIIGPPDQFRV